MNQVKLLEALKGILPENRILSADDDERAPYGSDWTRTPGNPGIVVFPKTVDEVSAIMRLCSKLKVPVVPSGGRTGLAGGAVAKNGELVLSLEKMNSIGKLDPCGLTLRVQAGVTTEAVHQFCEPHGLTWPIDLAAKGSSEIGGNLSTNAGGVRVIRYGMARRWVTGIQAVTVQGEILELNRGLEKNNTGYDLLQLILGSEGTLAVITEATLKLARLPSTTTVMFFPVQLISHAMTLFEAARRAPFEIVAYEFFSDKCLKAVEAQLGRKSRLQVRTPYYVLMEVEPRQSNWESWVESIFASKIVEDGVVAHSSEERKELWALREGITESLQKTSKVKKYDLSVSVDKLAHFLEDIENHFQQAKYKIDLYIFGHVGDGSPHLNLLQPQGVRESDFLADCEIFDRVLFEKLKTLGGSISAEHGVGLLKKSWVAYSRSAAELRLFRAIKNAFDPDGLLNPGKVVPE